MKENVVGTARQILDSYLETNNCRKTPERYAILEAAYDIGGHFSLEQIDNRLIEENFRVSRATLYNTMRLFLKLRLIIRHKFLEGTKYEAYYDNSNHCHQICTVCGKVGEINAPLILKAVNETKFKRFHKDGFSLYVYGICSACQSKITRSKSLEERKPRKKIDIK